MKLQRLLARLAALPPLAKHALWASYGAIGFGSVMTLTFCLMRYSDGKDPWKDLGYTATICLIGGATWGVVFGHMFSKKLREHGNKRIE